MKKQYGILAYPAGHSLSPAMHNAAFKALKIQAEYGIYEIPNEKLGSFMKKVRGENFGGLSVSLPYKELIMSYMDEIDPDALKIGAVNTVVNKSGVLYGYNTDFIGSNQALKESIGDLKEKIAVIIGAGGAARAIVYGLLTQGAHIWIKNRTKGKADEIAIEFAEMFDTEIHSDEWDNWQTGDILINATSCWMGPQDKENYQLPDFCAESFVKEFEVVMDINYNPLITPLILRAKELGLKIITGDTMLLYQAAEQFKLWTWNEAPIGVMAKALMKAFP